MTTLLLSLLTLSATDQRPGFFVEAQRELLPGVTTTCGSPDKDYILEVNGPGIVVEDFDGDGRLDLVVIDGSTLERVAAGEPGFPPRLFLGKEGGGFELAGESWKMAGGRFGTGGAAGDVNGDGFFDLVICEWGADRLFLNRGGEGFDEVPFEETGFRGRGWSTSACFLDYDGDSHLDLIVIGYLAFDPERIAARGEAEGCSWKGHAVMCGPEGLIPIHDRLYRGDGQGGFTDVSVAAGFKPTEAGFGLGVTTLDYDLDGDTDVYVTNDSTPNHLWENQGDGTFLEVGFQRSVSTDANGKEQAGMGIACGDFDGDGREDLFVTNFSGENNALYASRRKNRYKERSHRVGLGGPSQQLLGWGTGFGDFDLDGDLDLFVLNGHVYPQADRAGTDTSYAQLDQVFLNDGERFEERPLSDAGPGVSRSGLACDLDGDGRLELVCCDLDGAVRILENPTPTDAGHWLGVRLRGTRSNRHGLGARVVVRAGEREVAAELRSSAGYQASGPAAAHFGFGKLAGEELDEVRVHWPSGLVTKLEGVKPDRWMRIDEPAPEPEREEGQ